jgi:hypothetical protein
MEAETDEKRRRKETVQTDEAHSFFDEPVLDIYPSRDVFGFRIRSTGFDFSCLGDQMEKFAAANLAALIEQIRRVQRDVVLIDRYAAARSALDSLWPRSRSQRSSTVQRRAFGGIGQKRTALSDNTVQFTKFSRLQRHFL